MTSPYRPTLGGSTPVRGSALPTSDNKNSSSDRVSIRAQRNDFPIATRNSPVSTNTLRRTEIASLQGAPSTDFSSPQQITSKNAKIARLNSLTDSIGGRTRLSTTGYLSAIERTNNPGKSDTQSSLTLQRAEEYLDAAQRAFPTETLKSLAALQQKINNVKGTLVSPNEMSPNELAHALQNCRSAGFANCDIQALEVGLHLKHQLGISNFKIFSNDKYSHNYVVIDACHEFPKGAIVDSWTGKGAEEMSLGKKMELKHFANNLKINSNMMKFIDEFGQQYVQSSKG